MQMFCSLIEGVGVVQFRGLTKLSTIESLALGCVPRRASYPNYDDVSTKLPGPSTLFNKTRIPFVSSASVRSPEMGK